MMYLSAALPHGLIAIAIPTCLKTLSMSLFINSLDAYLRTVASSSFSRLWTSHFWTLISWVRSTTAICICSSLIRCFVFAAWSSYAISASAWLGTKKYWNVISISVFFYEWNFLWMEFFYGWMDGTWWVTNLQFDTSHHPLSTFVFCKYQRKQTSRADTKSSWYKFCTNRHYWVIMLKKKQYFLGTYRN